MTSAHPGARALEIPPTCTAVRPRGEPDDALHASPQSIRQAHDGLQPGQLVLNAGELLDANANRSPTAYENNPPEERARYKHDTDKRMVQLGLLGSDGR